ncbi:hypothetical protein TSMEX_007550, partial [Taenia solium]
MDVNKQRKMEAYSASENTLTIFTTFLCLIVNSHKQKQTSFPLSRFVKGQSSFNIDFAVKGASSSSRKPFQVMSFELTADLVKDKASDLRIFHGVFTSRPDVPWENFVWATSSSNLSVSVDYTQSGVSPEVVECN